MIAIEQELGITVEDAVDAVLAFVLNEGRTPSDATDEVLPRIYGDLHPETVYALARTGLLRSADDALRRRNDSLGKGVAPRSGRFRIGVAGTGKNSIGARYLALQQVYRGADGTMKPILDFTLADLAALRAHLSLEIEGLRDTDAAASLAENLCRRHGADSVRRLPAAAKAELNDKFGSGS